MLLPHIHECSRTRLEFKDSLRLLFRQGYSNAVAPDWNLKKYFSDISSRKSMNAVAPDWNLKYELVDFVERLENNAVAPDWNLKFSMASLLAVLF